MFSVFSCGGNEKKRSVLFGHKTSRHGHPSPSGDREVMPPSFLYVSPFRAENKNIYVSSDPTAKAGACPQLSRKIRILGTQGIVGLVVQLHPVATFGFKTETCNRIEASGVLCHRAKQDMCLYWRRFQVYNKCSVHAESISYIRTFVNRQEFPTTPAQRRNGFHPHA